MDNVEYLIINDSFKVVLLPLPIQTVSIGIAVPVGARDELPNERGIAHLLEHMIFAGTTSRTGDEIDKRVESLGASINAYTNYTETVYYVHGNGKYFAELLDVIIDIYLNSVYPEKEFLLEKEIVKEEIKKSYEDAPGVKSYLAAIDYLFKDIDERMRHRVAGYVDDIHKYTRDDIIRFHQRTYKQSYLVIAGRFNKNKVLAFLEDTFGKHPKIWKRKYDEMDSKLSIPYYGNMDKEIRIESTAQQSNVAFYFRSVTERSRWTTHMGILSYILTGNLNSMLTKVLRKEMGAVYSVDSYQRLYKDIGYFVISFSCNKDMTDDCIRAVWKVLQTLRDGHINDDYLKIVKNLRETRNLFVFENYENYFDMVLESVLSNTKVPTPAKIMKRIQGVTIKDLHILAKKVFDKKNSLVVIEG